MYLLTTLNAMSTIACSLGSGLFVHHVRRTGLSGHLFEVPCCLCASAHGGIHSVCVGFCHNDVHARIRDCGHTHRGMHAGAVWLSILFGKRGKTITFRVNLNLGGKCRGAGFGVLPGMSCTSLKWMRLKQVCPAHRHWIESAGQKVPALGCVSLVAGELFQELTRTSWQKWVVPTSLFGLVPGSRELCCGLSVPGVRVPERSPSLRTMAPSPVPHKVVKH